MGPGEGATEKVIHIAGDLGRLIARNGWILLTGGRDTGVMDAAGLGAKAEGGTVVGILPGTDLTGMSQSVDIPIVTGMHEARNNINILSCCILFFIGMNPGTASELALALKYKKPSILVSQTEETVRVFEKMSSSGIETADNAVSAIEKAQAILDKIHEKESA